MKTFIHEGRTLSLTAPYAVASGAGLKSGAIIGIANSAAANGAAVEVDVVGVFDVDTDTGAAWAVGDTIYWDDTAKKFTKTTTSNTKAGYAVAAKASGGVKCWVRLVPTI